MPHDGLGWVHTLAAVIALIAGSIILSRIKGDRIHKWIGRVYGISMAIVCVTSFMIYRVHGSFGILHIFAVVSTVTLILGMAPLYFNLGKTPVLSHLAWMYWSVIGLYCAFAAELFTRLPAILKLEGDHSMFYSMVGIATAVVGGIGAFFFKRSKDHWISQFSNYRINR